MAGCRPDANREDFNHKLPTSMKSETTFIKTAGVIALLSGPVALVSIILIFVAFNWDFDIAFNPLKAIAFEPDPAATLRWGWILDIFGYYLPLVPAALVLHRWLSANAPLYSQLFSLCGLAFIFIGATGAAMLAGATEPLYETYRAGGETDKAVAAQIFANVNNEVMSGIWNLFSMTLASIWWLGVGWLMRPANKVLAIFTQVLGLAALIDVLGYMFQSEAISGIGLNFYLFAAPLWAMWLGLYLWRNSTKIAN